jgi:hypothetical protein
MINRKALASTITFQDSDGEKLLISDKLSKLVVNEMLTSQLFYMRNSTTTPNPEGGDLVIQSSLWTTGEQIYKPATNSTDSKFIIEPAKILYKNYTVTRDRFQNQIYFRKLKTYLVDDQTEVAQAAFKIQQAQWFGITTLAIENHLYKVGLAKVKAQQALIEASVKTATTFEKGAIFESNSYTGLKDKELANAQWHNIKRAVSRYRNIGSGMDPLFVDFPNRKVRGQNPKDAVIVMTSDKLANLKLVTGLVNSNIGFSKIFEGQDILEMFGFPVLVSQELPNNLDFMICRRTGPWASMVFQPQGLGLSAITMQNPEVGFERLCHQVFQSVNGFVHPDLVVMGIDTDIVIYDAITGITGNQTVEQLAQINVQPGATEGRKGTNKDVGSLESRNDTTGETYTQENERKQREFKERNRLIKEKKDIAKQNSQVKKTTK